MKHFTANEFGHYLMWPNDSSSKYFFVKILNTPSSFLPNLSLFKHFFVVEITVVFSVTRTRIVIVEGNHVDH